MFRCADACCYWLILLLPATYHITHCMFTLFNKEYVVPYLYYSMHMCADVHAAPTTNLIIILIDICMNEPKIVLKDAGFSDYHSQGLDVSL